MGSHRDHHDCGYDYDNTWEYECQKSSHRPRRRHGWKRHEDTWSYGAW